MHEEKVRLAVTLGDPGGIGPEIVAAMLARGRMKAADVFLIGSAPVLRDALPDSLGGGMTVVPGGEVDSIGRQESFPAVIDTSSGESCPAGRPSAAGGGIAGRSIEAAASLARNGMVEGIVTGPVSKEALNLAGYQYRGHTDMLASLFDAPDCQMMMVAGDLRILILTRDIPLREVPEAVTENKLRTAIRVVTDSMRELWNIEDPRIAVAAVNPHAGDGGFIGREETDLLVPVLEELSHQGYNVSGPYPADTLFHAWRRKEYDVYVAMYHDQGMIPFKMGGFKHGVNITLGLPVVRTSVCHGTAFDIVGQDASDPGSMEAAFDLAVRCCLARKRKLRAGR